MKKKIFKNILNFLPAVLSLAIAAVLIVNGAIGHRKITKLAPISSQITEEVPVEGTSSGESTDEGTTTDFTDSSEYEADTDVSDTAYSDVTSTASKPNGQNANNVASSGAYGVKTKNGMVFTVEEFGAKGDGKTDDGAAVNDAVVQAAKYTSKHDGKTAEIRFKANKTYILKNQNFEGANCGYNIYVSNAKNLKIIGNNTTITGSNDKGYLRLEGCTGVTVQGLNFTLNRDVACRAEVVSRNEKTVVFTVPKWYSECVSKYKLPNYAFAVPDNGGRGQTAIDTIEKINNTTVKIVFKNYTGYANAYGAMNAGTYVFLPTPGYSHEGNGFRIANNTTVTLKDIKVWNNKQFVFNILNNTKEVKFDNVYLGTKTDNSCETVSWRDIVHAKDNRGKLTFNNCVFKGAHDDVFNLSNTMLRVDAVKKTGSGTELTVYGLDYSGAYMPFFVGDTVVGLNETTGKYYGETKVVKAVSGNKIVVKGKYDIDVGAYIYFKEYANPDTTITGGEYSGSFRIRSSGTKITGTRFNVMFMYTSFEYSEGPIPSDILYKGCSFGPINPLYDGKTLMTFDCKPEVKNIIFDNCIFAYDKIIDRSKVGNGVIIK